MHVVALCELAGNAADEARELASILGVGTYDVRVSLGGVLPRVVLQTPDLAAPDDAVRRLRARGHGALACALADVVAGTGMVQVHRFIADDAALWANDGEGDFLPWESIGAIVLVARSVEVVRTTRSREPISARPGRPSPTMNVLDRTRERITDQVAYLFPRERSFQPWMMREQQTQYLSLGSRMKLTRHDNFKETLAIVRSRAAGAIYDERFAKDPRTAAQLVLVQGHDAATPDASDASVDVVVHLLAEWLLRGRGGPYRQSGRIA